jgi:hypothetical protein
MNGLELVGALLLAVIGGNTLARACLVASKSSDLAGARWLFLQGLLFVLSAAVWLQMLLRQPGQQGAPLLVAS